MVTDETGFLYSTNRMFDRAAAKLDLPPGLAEQIKGCNSVYQVRFSLKFGRLPLWLRWRKSHAVIKRWGFKMKVRKSYRPEVIEMRHGEGNAGAISGFLVGCVAGLVIGSALGVLFAPHKGSDSRERLRRKIVVVKANGKKSDCGEGAETESKAKPDGASAIEEN